MWAIGLLESSLHLIQCRQVPAFKRRTVLTPHHSGLFPIRNSNGSLIQKLSALFRPSAVFILCFVCLSGVLVANSLFLAVLFGSIDTHRAVLRFVSVVRARKGDQSQGRWVLDSSNSGLCVVCSLSYNELPLC